MTGATSSPALNTYHVPHDQAPRTGTGGDRTCRGCDLWVNATQTVPGEGSSPAEVMLIGEAPGDVEDRAGHPFVGPARKLLGKQFRVTQQRGTPMHSEVADAIIATVHPSAVLRLQMANENVPGGSLLPI